jgi:hypothetical protein
MTDNEHRRFPLLSCEWSSWRSQAQSRVIDEQRSATICETNNNLHFVGTDAFFVLFLMSLEYIVVPSVVASEGEKQK